MAEIEWFFKETEKVAKKKGCKEKFNKVSFLKLSSKCKKLSLLIWAFLFVLIYALCKV